MEAGQGNKYYGWPRAGLALQPERGNCSLANTKAEAVCGFLTISRWVGVSRPDGYPWPCEAVRRLCEWLFEGLRLASSCSFHCGALVCIMPRAWGEKEERVTDRAEQLQRETKAATSIRLGTRSFSDYVCGNGSTEPCRSECPGWHPAAVTLLSQ